VLVRGEDLFHDVFSAKELLTFAAKLRVHGPAKHRQNVVEIILRDFELESNQNIKIKDYSRYNIPNIEKRKISLALEILDDPAIIFIDDVIGGAENGGISNDRVGQFALISMIKKEAR
jgi:ABC-type multidrug transport system ATPase subunit